MSDTTMESYHESKRPGRRLLTNSIDAIGVESPQKTAITQFISLDPQPIRFDLTYSDLATLINRLAWWLDKTCLKGRARDTTIAYLGLSDIRHTILWLAATKTGSKLLFLSARNSVPVHEHLLEKTECSVLLFDSFFASDVKEITAAPETTAVQVPGLVDLLSDKTSIEPYPYTDTFTTASGTASVLFHTSGSTGLPKPVPSTHAALAAVDVLRLPYTLESSPNSENTLMQTSAISYCGFPLFHVAAYLWTGFMLFSGNNTVFGPPHQPSNAEMFKTIRRLTQADSAFLPPLVVDETAQDLAFVNEEVPKLRFVATTGGSVSQKAGDTISQKTRLMNHIGSSESGIMGEILKDSKDWQWFHFAEKEVGIQWRPISSEDVDGGKDEGEYYYEMVICRDDTLPLKQAVFQNFPHLEEWPTKDVFSPHPTIPNYWKYQGRRDDIVVFSTGEKMNPISVEGHLNSVPGVQASLVIGHKRPYPILLVELRDPGSLDETLPKIRQALEGLNREAMDYAHIQDSDIIVGTPEKPFARTPKGTINRVQTTKLYEAEIDALYESEVNMAGQVGELVLDPSTSESLERTIADLVKSLTLSDEVSIHDDFFMKGLDSRKVQILAAALSRVLPDDKDVPFLRSAIYMKRTANQLVEYIFQSGTAENALDTFNDMFKRYSATLSSPRKATPPQTAHRGEHHILLTGSTGFIGSFILRSLLQRTNVTEITCLDRRITDLPVVDRAVPVRKLQGDLSQPYLGLPQAEYSRLGSTVTEIIHCQWPVTFNLPLPLFEPHIAGVSNLIHLAYNSHHNARIVFLSSIATIQGWDQSTPVPEEPLDSFQYARGGYGQSKMLASKLLQHAGTTSGISSAICRVGQIAGPVHTPGVWPARDWFPTMLRASKILGCLPRSLGRFEDVDWLPVDFLSEALADLTVGRNVAGSTLTEYYHLTNPAVACFEDLVPGISSRLGEKCKLVALGDWIDALKSWESRGDAEGGAGAAETPLTEAMALLEFYQGLVGNGSVRLDTAMTVRQTSHLEKVGRVDPSWMETWLDQWGFC